MKELFEVLLLSDTNTIMQESHNASTARIHKFSILDADSNRSIQIRLFTDLFCSKQYRGINLRGIFGAIDI